MRIGYSDEEEFSGQFFLWQANCERSLAGKAGRQALTDLRDELLRMNVKRLIGNDLAVDGEVCAVGALLKARGVPQDRLESFDDLYQTTDDIAVREGRVPKLVAWKLVELNDMDLVSCTPEERYAKVLAWVEYRLSRATNGNNQTTSAVRCSVRR